ncbi:unnamed protein product [Brassica rapa]|uniref:Knr4/Smi1-like domain-containing protein n=2 Tax=Brassica TaxID=3705 RepID=A0A3P5YKI4_BRACM|nr:unnamed protein product [Brassica napus]CAG7866511.1 unnamed protein product [Brassica rapa]CDY49436.1 BnaA09g42310D [Brassica napus]VDC63505.1 unnamed protein product [Brassica rapa]
MNHRLPGIISPLSYITTDPIRSSVKPPIPVYCKTTINHLKSLTGLDVSPGLTNQEISAVESSIGISFPLDLRSILQTGLPVGTKFPNWRSGSTRNNLLLLFNLPLLHVSKLVVRNGFWVDSWGTRPGSDAEALSLVKKFVEFAPVLVPVYENFYVPSTTPNLAGNPVFRIDGDGVTVLSCDVAGFLQGLNGSDEIRDSGGSRRRRRVEFWTDVAERGRMTVARGPTRGWWSALSCDERIRACLDDAFWKLREAGWKEDEVREMMVMDGVDGDTCTEDEDFRKGGEVTTLRALLYSQEP